VSENVLSARYEQERGHLKAGLKRWKREIRNLAVPIDPNVVVAGRVKQLQSLLVKAYKKGPEHPRTWDSFGDLVALKAVFPTKEGAEDFTHLLEEEGKRAGYLLHLDRRVSAPDELTYASNQFDVCDPRMSDSAGQGIKAEIQVRTVASDAWYMVDHRVRYKGSIKLPDELRRKVLRLIVLAELFDSEVESLIQEVRQLEGNQLAPVFSRLTNAFNAFLGTYSPASRPENLFETLIHAYPRTAIEDLETRIEKLVTEHGQDLRHVIEDHSRGSDDYVEAYDWLYREPETLLIADLARNFPSRLRAIVGTTDFDAFLGPMATSLKGR
jgi:ppGpp synthetase/RelA/SpoT-type nucleotidyltranferase